MRNLSPLRYPGGKVRLAPFFSQIIAAQDPIPSHYAEPFDNAQQAWDAGREVERKERKGK